MCEFGYLGIKELESGLHYVELRVFTLSGSNGAVSESAFTASNLLFSRDIIL